MIRFSPMTFVAAGALLLLSFAPTQSFGADLPSSVIVESFRGSVTIDEAQAKRHQVVPANGKVIKTGENSFVALVLSNGTAIYCGPESHLEIIEAHQEEFTEFYAGSDFEDKISITRLKLLDGEFGFDQPDPNPTSTLSIETPFGEIEGDAISFAVVIDNLKAVVATLKGSLYFTPDGSKRRFVAEDEALDLAIAARKTSAMALTPLRATGRQIYRPLVERAERARTRILISETDGRIAFQIVRTPESIKGAAFNDYRLP